MPEQSSHSEAPETPLLVGTVLLLVQFDICEEIRVDQLAGSLGARAVTQGSLPSPPSGHVRYTRPPVVEEIGNLTLLGEGSVRGELKYYDYGVVSLLLHLPFSGDWNGLIRVASRWIWEVDAAAHAERIVRERIPRVLPYMVKPYTRYLSEDYLIFHIREIAGLRNAEDVTSRYAKPIAQVVRGETGDLADTEVAEVMRSRISYYNTDLAVIGWNAAFLYDTAAGAESAIQLLEYANSQLLEFRHYDELLTRELEQVYKRLEERSGRFARWRLAREATRLQATLLEVSELTEHADNAIKFLSDMFLARLYRLAAARVGVSDYKDLVTSKIHVAEDLYRFMVDQFNQSRAFFLELIVVIILIVELVFLFRGKPF